MPRHKNPVPTYRRHKQSGQAVVTVRNPDGSRRDVLLGKYDTPESRAEYQRVLAEIQAGSAPPQTASAAPVLTVNELLLRFLRHAEEHYRHPDGTATSELYNFKLTLRPVRELYGHTPAKDFGPVALKAVREVMIRKRWCRKQINSRIGRIRRVWKWAASEELLPVAAFQALATVSGLQAGRSAAKELPPVRAVPAADVEAVLPCLNRHVRGLVLFQRLTGCRPGEACRVRMCDVDTSGAVWVYKPERHKTQWKGKARAVAVGPQCQAMLKDFITADPADYLFSPRLAVAELHAARAAARKTPRYPSHMKRNAAVRKREPGSGHNRRYTLYAYETALDRACVKAGVPSFTPNQLRHLFATELRKRYGLETAGASLGHSKMSATEIYAEKDFNLALRAAAEVG